jgi:hypothetical protein
MIKAVRSIVHEGFSIKEAADLLMTEKKIEERNTVVVKQKKI